VVVTELSLIVEMDNAALVEWDEVRDSLDALRGELEGWMSSRPGANAEVIFVQPGDAADAQTLREKIEARIPAFAAHSEIQFRGVPDGRYYDLKNEGIRSAKGDIVVFYDSDTTPEPGWLPAMTKPFDDPAIIGVYGMTALDYDDFLSRVYALFWFFPLRDNDDRKAAKRSLNANNCAFRRAWIAANPFPYHPGFKVSCSMLWRRILTENIPMARADVWVLHKPPRGLRFFVWRALVAGRDQDRRYAEFRSPKRGKRLWHAFSRLFSQLWETARRAVLHHGDVGISAWQAPAAFLLWTGFVLLTFAGHVGHALRFGDDVVETVPDAIKVS
jgi:glycosyltransferase involved in cell wall biosynthesis